jgi:pimeloyl-ACP methyl ester carboxylesterase
MDALGVPRFHLVGAKIGGIIARAFAARRPERVRTLTVVGSPPPFRKGAERIPALNEELETRGVEHWARRTMAGRLGDRFPREGIAWWIKFMSRTPVSTLVGFNATINDSDIREDMPRIACPTLVITTDESGLASVDETRAWQETIRDSELLVIPGKSFHVAASDAERCAQATVDFITRRGAG